MKREELSEPQLQLWDAATKHYIPVPMDTPRGKAWRIVHKAWPLKNPKIRAPIFTGSAHTIEDKQAAYLIWATAKKLPCITAFSNRPPRNCYPALHGKPAVVFPGAINYVDADRYFQVTEETES